jgi:hypothetical protein
MITPNGPGKFGYGQFGSAGQTNGFGHYWEPNMYPPYDILDDPPTQSEIDALIDHRMALSTDTCTNFSVVDEGGMCKPASGITGSELFRVDIIRHYINYNGESRPHYALVRYPESEAPTHAGGYPILLMLHGNYNPIRVQRLGGWGDTLGYNTFYKDQCVVVYPLYLGYRFDTPYPADHTWREYRYFSDCEDALDPEIPLFDGAQYGTYPIEFPPDGETVNDLQIKAILQSLNGVIDHYGSGVDPLVNGDVGIIGGSMGANMVYDIAPIMYENEAPGNLKVSIAIYGGTDQYAPFNVRRSKRLLKSRLNQMVYVEDLNRRVMRKKATYGDISENQRKRTTSSGVQWYLCPDHTTCPDGEEPDMTEAEMKTSLRNWFLEESVSRLWDYPDGPYPLQVHHGTLDPTVYVENSRWLEQQMRNNDVPIDADNFQYYETPGAGHNTGDFSQASRDEMAKILRNELGWVP